MKLSRAEVGGGVPGRQWLAGQDRRWIQRLKREAGLAINYTVQTSVRRSGVGK
jgi:hypothetical protein